MLGSRFERTISPHSVNPTRMDPNAPAQFVERMFYDIDQSCFADIEGGLPRIRQLLSSADTFNKSHISTLSINRNSFNARFISISTILR